MPKELFQLRRLSIKFPRKPSEYADTQKNLAQMSVYLGFPIIHFRNQNENTFSQLTDALETGNCRFNVDSSN